MGAPVTTTLPTTTGSFVASPPAMTTGSFVAAPTYTPYAPTAVASQGSFVMTQPTFTPVPAPVSTGSLSVPAAVPQPEMASSTVGQAAHAAQEAVATPAK